MYFDQLCYYFACRLLCFVDDPHTYALHLPLRRMLDSYQSTCVYIAINDTVLFAAMVLTERFGVEAYLLYLCFDGCISVHW